MAAPEAAKDFAQNPESSFERYGLTAQERALLSDGSKEALHALGVHPNLQMKYERLRTPVAAGGPGPLAAWLDRLTGRV